MLLITLIVPGRDALHGGFIDQIGRISHSFEKNGLSVHQINDPGSLDNIPQRWRSGLQDSRGSCLPFFNRGGKNKAWLKGQPGRYNDKKKALHRVLFSCLTAQFLVLFTRN
jgi:hypothetical protein